jgi:uncharacterized protein (DUF2147 family)
MTIKIKLIAILVFLCGNLLYAQTFKGDDILGTWKTGDGNLQVKISKKGDIYNGIIVWMKEPTNQNGTPKLDQYNPDISKRKNPILGNAIMIDEFKFIGSNTWDNGIIYDARNGKTYSCIIKMKTKNTLDVRGYWGISLLGQTDTWIRVN